MRMPEAPIEQMWTTHKEHLRLVGPRNRPNYRVIVVGTSAVIDGFDKAVAERLLPGAAFAKLGYPRFEPYAVRALPGARRHHPGRFSPGRSASR